MRCLGRAFSGPHTRHPRRLPPILRIVLRAVVFLMGLFDHGAWTRRIRLVLAHRCPGRSFARLVVLGDRPRPRLGYNFLFHAASPGTVLPLYAGGSGHRQAARAAAPPLPDRASEWRTLHRWKHPGRDSSEHFPTVHPPGSLAAEASSLPLHPGILIPPMHPPIQRRQHQQRQRGR